MRIWDIGPERLCRQHLLGEHRELHAVWSVITQGKRGYSNHPETNRRRGKLATGSQSQEALVDTLQRQEDILKNKGCDCLEDA